METCNVRTEKDLYTYRCLYSGGPGGLNYWVGKDSHSSSALAKILPELHRFIKAKSDTVLQPTGIILCHPLSLSDAGSREIQNVLTEEKNRLTSLKSSSVEVFNNNSFHQTKNHEDLIFHRARLNFLSKNKTLIFNPPVHSKRSSCIGLLYSFEEPRYLECIPRPHVKQLIPDLPPNWSVVADEDGRNGYGKKNGENDNKEGKISTGQDAAGKGVEKFRGSGEEDIDLEFPDNVDNTDNDVIESVAKRRKIVEEIPMTAMSQDLSFQLLDPIQARLNGSGIQDTPSRGLHSTPRLRGIRGGLDVSGLGGLNEEKGNDSKDVGGADARANVKNGETEKCGNEGMNEGATVRGFLGEDNPDILDIQDVLSAAKNDPSGKCLEHVANADWRSLALDGKGKDNLHDQNCSIHLQNSSSGKMNNKFSFLDDILLASSSSGSNSSSSVDPFDLLWDPSALEILRNIAPEKQKPLTKRLGECFGNVGVGNSGVGSSSGAIEDSQESQNESSKQDSGSQQLFGSEGGDILDDQSELSDNDRFLFFSLLYLQHCVAHENREIRLVALRLTSVLYWGDLNRDRNESEKEEEKQITMPHERFPKLEKFLNNRLLRFGEGDWLVVRDSPKDHRREGECNLSLLEEKDANNPMIRTWVAPGYITPKGRAWKHPYVGESIGGVDGIGVANNSLASSGVPGNIAAKDGVKNNVLFSKKELEWTTVGMLFPRCLELLLPGMDTRNGIPPYEEPNEDVLRNGNGGSSVNVNQNGIPGSHIPGSHPPDSMVHGYQSGASQVPNTGSVGSAAMSMASNSSCESSCQESMNMPGVVQTPASLRYDLFGTAGTVVTQGHPNSFFSQFDEQGHRVKNGVKNSDVDLIWNNLFPSVSDFERGSSPDGNRFGGGNSVVTFDRWVRAFASGLLGTLPHPFKDCLGLAAIDTEFAKACVPHILIKYPNKWSFVLDRVLEYWTDGLGSRVENSMGFGGNTTTGSTTGLSNHTNDSISNILRLQITNVILESFTKIRRVEENRFVPQDSVNKEGITSYKYGDDLSMSLVDSKIFGVIPTPDESLPRHGAENLFVFNKIAQLHLLVSGGSTASESSSYSNAKSNANHCIATGRKSTTRNDDSILSTSPNSHAIQALWHHETGLILRNRRIQNSLYGKVSKVRNSIDIKFANAGNQVSGSAEITKRKTTLLDTWIDKLPKHPQHKWELWIKKRAKRGGKEMFFEIADRLELGLEYADTNDLFESGQGRNGVRGGSGVGGGISGSNKTVEDGCDFLRQMHMLNGNAGVSGNAAGRGSCGGFGGVGGKLNGRNLNGLNGSTQRGDDIADSAYDLLSSRGLGGIGVSLGDAFGGVGGKSKWNWIERRMESAVRGGEWEVPESMRRGLSRYGTAGAVAGGTRTGNPFSSSLRSSASEGEVGKKENSASSGNNAGSLSGGGFYSSIFTAVRDGRDSNLDNALKILHNDVAGGSASSLSIACRAQIVCDVKNHINRTSQQPSHSSQASQSIPATQHTQQQQHFSSDLSSLLNSHSVHNVHESTMHFEKFCRPLFFRKEIEPLLAVRLSLAAKEAAQLQVCNPNPVRGGGNGATIRGPSAHVSITAQNARSFLPESYFGPVLRDSLEKTSSVTALTSARNGRSTTLNGLNGTVNGTGGVFSTGNGVNGLGVTELNTNTLGSGAPSYMSDVGFQVNGQIKTTIAYAQHLRRVWNQPQRALQVLRNGLVDCTWNERHSKKIENYVIEARKQTELVIGHKLEDLNLSANAGGNAGSNSSGMGSGGGNNDGSNGRSNDKNLNDGSKGSKKRRSSVQFQSGDAADQSLLNVGNSNASSASSSSIPPKPSFHLLVQDAVQKSLLPPLNELRELLETRAQFNYECSISLWNIGEKTRAFDRLRKALTSTAIAYREYKQLQTFEACVNMRIANGNNKTGISSGNNSSGTGSGGSSDRIEATVQPFNVHLFSKMAARLGQWQQKVGQGGGDTDFLELATSVVLENDSESFRKAHEESGKGGGNSGGEIGGGGQQNDRSLMSYPHASHAPQASTSHQSLSHQMFFGRLNQGLSLETAKHHYLWKKSNLSTASNLTGITGTSSSGSGSFFYLKPFLWHAFRADECFRNCDEYVESKAFKEKRNMINELDKKQNATNAKDANNSVGSNDKGLACSKDDIKSVLQNHNVFLKNAVEALCKCLIFFDDSYGAVRKIVGLGNDGKTKNSSYSGVGGSAGAGSASAGSDENVKAENNTNSKNTRGKWDSEFCRVVGRLITLWLKFPDTVSEIIHSKIPQMQLKPFVTFLPQLTARIGPLQTKNPSKAKPKDQLKPDEDSYDQENNPSLPSLPSTNEDDGLVHHQPFQHALHEILVRLLIQVPFSTIPKLFQQKNVVCNVGMKRSEIVERPENTYKPQAVKQIVSEAEKKIWLWLARRKGWMGHFSSEVMKTEGGGGKNGESSKDGGEKDNNGGNSTNNKNSSEATDFRMGSILDCRKPLSTIVLEAFLKKSERTHSQVVSEVKKVLGSVDALSHHLLFPGNESVEAGHQKYYENLLKSSTVSGRNSLSGKVNPDILKKLGAEIQRSNLYLMQDKWSEGIESCTLFGKRIRAFDHISGWSIGILGYKGGNMQRKGGGGIWDVNFEEVSKRKLMDKYERCKNLTLKQETHNNSRGGGRTGGSGGGGSGVAPPLTKAEQTELNKMPPFLTRLMGVQKAQIQTFNTSKGDLEVEKIFASEHVLELASNNASYWPPITSSPCCPVSLQYRRGALMQNLPNTFKFVGGGISAPRTVNIYDKRGKMHKQLLKGDDDSRPDQIFQQLFKMMNRFLDHPLRTYEVLPLSPKTCVMEFVQGTMTFGTYLTPTTNDIGAHARYFPEDLTYGEVSKEFMSTFGNSRCPNKQQEYGRDQRSLTAEEFELKYWNKRIDIWKEMCPRFHPALQFFFLEKFRTPESWFYGTQNYAKSLAVSSIVGFILGLGDRHTNNLLLDPQTGEIFHIDFGQCFEFSRDYLPVRERVPFRMTRDIVAGLGSQGIRNGVFRKMMEGCLGKLRENRELLSVVVEVFCWDPLARWVKAVDGVGGKDEKKGSKNYFAQKAILEIQEKLQLRDSFKSTGLLKIPDGGTVLGSFCDGGEEKLREDYFRMGGMEEEEDLGFFDGVDGMGGDGRGGGVSNGGRGGAGRGGIGGKRSRRNSLSSGSASSGGFGGNESELNSILPEYLAVGEPSPALAGLFGQGLDDNGGVDGGSGRGGSDGRGRAAAATAGARGGQFEDEAAYTSYLLSIATSQDYLSQQWAGWGAFV